MKSHFKKLLFIGAVLFSVGSLAKKSSLRNGTEISKQGGLGCSPNYKVRAPRDQVFSKSQIRRNPASTNKCVGIFNSASLKTLSSDNSYLKLNQSVAIDKMSAQRAIDLFNDLKANKAVIDIAWTTRFYVSQTDYLRSGTTQVEKIVLSPQGAQIKFAGIDGSLQLLDRKNSVNFRGDFDYDVKVTIRLLNVPPATKKSLTILPSNLEAELIRSGLSQETITAISENSPSVLLFQDLVKNTDMAKSLEGAVLLGIQGDHSEYKHWQKLFKFIHFDDIYVQHDIVARSTDSYGKASDPTLHTRIFLEELAGKKKVFFVPNGLNDKGRQGITFNEINWLVTHPEEIQNTVFVFGAYNSYYGNPQFLKLGIKPQKSESKD